MPGFPIRTSSDPRSVDSSPRHIAASHVLHRLSMPRHPPCALTHLQTQKPRNKKLQKQTDHKACLLDARNHYPQNKHHTPPPRWSDNTPTPTRGHKQACCLRTQQCAQPESRPPEAQGCWRLVSSLVAVRNSTAPPTTHYRRRHKLSQPHHPHPCEVRGNHGAP